VTLNLPSPLEESLSPQAAALHLAIGLYVSREASLSRAAKVAGLHVGDFMEELCRREIALNYGPKDLDHDLKVVSEFLKQ
jgi:predicted HTH domain antitoxin